MLPNLPLLLINRVLRDESWAQRRLKTHAGQTARLELGGITVRVTIDGEGFLQLAAASTADDVTVSLPASAIPLIMDAPHEITRHAHIEGSAALADTLGVLLQHLRPDIAGWLAPFIGDVLAARSVRTAEKAARGGLQIARLGETVIYRLLHEQLRAIPDARELDTFGNEVSRLAQDLEKLEARFRS